MLSEFSLPREIPDAHLLSTISNGLGRALTLNYASGRITSVTDGTGRSVSYGYDAAGNLVSALDTLSRAVTYEYDLPGRLTKCFLPANPTVPVFTNVFDTLDRVQTQANARNQVFTYYFAGSRSEEVNPLGNARVLYFNQFGSPKRQINALGKQTTTLYDGLNRPVEVIAPEGNKVKFTYDKNNNVLTKTFVAKPGSGLSDIQLVFTYSSSWAKPITVANGNGNVTNLAYDPANGNLLTITQPLVGGVNPVTTFSYNLRGQVLTITDPTGIVTKFNYDLSTEKLTSVIFDYSAGPGHLNLAVAYGYDAVGNVNSVTSPNGHQYLAVHDTERRVTQKTAPSPFGYITNYSYDFNGNLGSVQRQVAGDPAWQTISYTYSVTDKVATVSDPLNRLTTLTYDGNDRLLSILDAEGRLSQYFYDVLDRFSSFVDPSSTTAETKTYSDNGLVKTKKDASNNLTQYAYDGFDRRATITYADSSTTQITSYDQNGNVLAFVNRAGNPTTLTYDALNRLSTKSPFGLATVTYGYDLAGRLVTVSKPLIGGDPSTGTFQNFFDTAGRFFKEQYPDGKTVVHELDANGNRTKTTWPDGYFITRSFDQLDRLVNIFLNGAGSPAVSYSYDQLSRVSSVGYSNGTSSSYTFELNNDLVAMSHNFVGSSNAYSFSYNAVHELISSSMTDSSFVWHPASAGTVSYGTADSINRYPTVAGNSYSYDGNKNLTGDGVWTFGYDSENRLLSATKAGTTASYKYDPRNRQAQKTVNGTSTRFVYNGLRLIATYDGAGNLLTRYVHGAALDELVAQITAAGVVSFAHKDRLNSVVAISSASGAVTDKNFYSPFGECISVAGTILGYTGQRYDSETGLFYYRNRYYSPSIGRFLQPDPIGYAGGDLNLYTYVRNNPLNFIDPLGLSAEKPPSKGNKKLSDAPIKILFTTEDFSRLVARRLADIAKALMGHEPPTPTPGTEPNPGPSIFNGLGFGAFFNDSSDDSEGTAEEPAADDPASEEPDSEDPSDDYPDDDDHEGTEDDPIPVDPEDLEGFQFDEDKVYEVEGQLVTGHALNRLKERDIDWNSVRDTAQYPDSINHDTGGANPVHYGVDANGQTIGVPVNSNGVITTAYPVYP